MLEPANLEGRKRGNLAWYRVAETERTTEQDQLCEYWRR